jgi:hypothetical protein
MKDEDNNVKTPLLIAVAVFGIGVLIAGAVLLLLMLFT